MPGRDVFLGVDVGTNSARCVAVDGSGVILASHSQEINLVVTTHDNQVYHEYSSDDIWNACCATVRRVKAELGSDDVVKGVGFDATCSLVCLDENDNPVSVHLPEGGDGLNVICWMDHRAVEQADRINKTGHDVLKYVGDVISPEMECPKMLWLKERLPGQFDKVAHFLDLADFLTYKATQVNVRSLCTIVCKWTFMGHEVESSESGVVSATNGWSASFFKQIGLEDLIANDFSRIGSQVAAPGAKLGTGVTDKAAGELTLPAGTPVAVSLIDAHAGGVGMIGAQLDDAAVTPKDMSHRLALICGTSSCHMAVNESKLLTPGVWGPYYSAMVPGLWLAEGGQSATGALLDHVITSSGCYAELSALAKDGNKSTHEVLVERIASLAKERNVTHPAFLTADLHVLPDFHGNRSPRADPSLKGMITGLTLSHTIDDLALLYLATIQAIAYGTRHIIMELHAAGYEINTIFACGGDTKNTLFLREHADVTGCRLVLPRDPSSTVGVGAAVLGAAASGAYPSLLAAMGAMNAVQPNPIMPSTESALVGYHSKKYQVFHQMYKDQMNYRKLMED